jgi:hypothetical protein
MAIKGSIPALVELQTKRDAALLAARAVREGTLAEVNAATKRVTDAQAAVSDFITQGANPCPSCGTHPHGMEQDRGGDRVEYDVGCVAGCKGDDGRGFIVRGGALPRHAVEMWNEAHPKVS